jgi:hypothetical protein
MSSTNRIKPSEVKVVREELLDQQNGKCAVCGGAPKIPCLDHNHQTGAIRGVLCSGCNAYEGKISKWKHFAQVDDLPNWLRGLATYLETHSTDQTGLLHPTHFTPDEKKARAKKRRQKKLEQKNAR